MICLEDAVRDVIRANKNKFAEYGVRRDRLVQWFTGRVMRATDGKFDIKAVIFEVHEELARDRTHAPSMAPDAEEQEIARSYAEIEKQKHT